MTEFIQAVTQRHVEDCAEDVVRHALPLVQKYELDAEARADLMRAMTALVCDVVRKTADLYKEVGA